MNYFLIASLLILGQGIYSARLGSPQFEIRNGNCSKAVASDLVYQKHIHLSKIPFIVRDDKVSEKQTTYCLIIVFLSVYDFN